MNLLSDSPYITYQLNLVIVFLENNAVKVDERLFCMFKFKDIVLMAMTTEMGKVESSYSLMSSSEGQML